MSVGSRFFARVFALPPAVTHDVRRDADLPVRTRDGVILRTNVHRPSLPSAPTILIRTPYGRGGVIGLVPGRVLAERGFNVVLQSCRGTFGSGGVFDPMRYERDDGLDTIEWLKRQPWFDGTLFTYGPSYVGFTQWAIADAPEVTGALTAVTSSTFRGPTYAGGSFSLDTVLNWAALVRNQAGGSTIGFLLRQIRTEGRLRRGWNHTPLAEADTAGIGAEVPFFREWLANGDDDAYWMPRDHDHRVASVTAAICMVGGWYDIFLPWQLADYARMRAAGARPRLVIGPWTHASRDLLARSMREGVEWFREVADGGTRRPPVELYVGGAEQWRAYEDWPPEARTQEWFLGPDATLSTEAPATGVELDRFRFDPADPTPSPGGALLTTAAGRVDNRGVESRADMLVYTSPVLADDVEAIGPVSAEIRLRSSSRHFDVFVRVCDVSPDGRSENICDGLTRVVADGDESVVVVELWPTAYRWMAGHRIRVQIAGSAHPRYARNQGTGEPLGTGTAMRVVEHAVLVGSLIRLPRTDNAH
jgi:putative CocE/NonD family hydrolase